MHLDELPDHIRRKAQKERNVRPVRLAQDLIADAQGNFNILPDILGKIRKLLFEVLDPIGVKLHVQQSVWHTHTTTPKTEEASSPVPVIETLADILGKLREVEGNPPSGPILRGPSGKPLNLDNLSKRVVSPLLKAAGLEWHGWYSLRRGVATTLAGLTRDGMASKGLLRHTNLATTTRHYVKDVPENTLSAMNQLEGLFTKCSTRDTARVN